MDKVQMRKVSEGFRNQFRNWRVSYPERKRLGRELRWDLPKNPGLYTVLKLH